VRELNDRLRSDAELRAVFNDLLTQQIKLKELAEEAEMRAADEYEARDPVPANLVRLPEPAIEAPVVSKPRRFGRLKSNRPGRSSPVVAGLAMAASLALIATVVWWIMQPTRLARLSEIEGLVTIQRGAREITAQSGAVLRAGDRLVTALNSRARFAYLGEATEVQLAASSHLRMDLLNDSKHLQLDRGSFEASVARQPAGRPLTLLTQQAEAVVVGTRFRLQATDTNTRLEVFEGAVSILQSFEGPSMLVPAGQGVTVIPGRPVTLHRLAETRGSILLELWDEAGDTTNQVYLTQFMFSGVGVKPGGSRVRGYLHPPRPGAYSFHVDAGGDAELWMSESEHPAEASRIWSSADTDAEPIVRTLRANQSYYLELRSESDPGPDAFTVSWTTPSGQKRVIYGDYLSPFDPGDRPSGR
jgi:ferric-dicitrate binding protein FerR (iron transport regulator)